MPLVLQEPGPDLDAAFAALADPVRRALVSRLAQGDATVGELAAPFALTPQAISHHVGVLRRSGLVEQRREGTRRPCHLRAEQLSLLGSWIEDQRRAWDDRLDALERHLNEAGPTSAERHLTEAEPTGAERRLNQAAPASAEQRFDGPAR